MKQKYIFKTFFYFLCVCFFIFNYLSCNQQTPNDLPEITELKAHSWFYFTNKDFLQIDLPQNAPEVAIRPWTEAIRIAASGSNGNSACAIVNRLGILDFTKASAKKKPTLIRDLQIFEGITTDTLLFNSQNAVFHLYKNSHFNTNLLPALNQSNKRPLLVSYNFNSQLYSPILFYEDLGLPPQAQVTSIVQKSGKWQAAVKTQENNITNFSYLEFSTPEKNGEIPISDMAKITTKKITADDFRRSQKPKDFSQAPLAIKELFSAIPLSFEFFLTTRIENQTAPILFENSISQGYTHQGYASVFNVENNPEKQAALAVFSDGTTYISNILLKSNSEAQGITVFRLPKLPTGFIYGDIALCNSILYVGWEETDFYKTGRSGFIAVNLKSISESL